MTWKVLKDTEQEKPEVAKDPKQIAQEMNDAREAALQQQFDRDGAIATNAMTDMFAKQKRDAEIRAKMDKERKTMLALGKTTITFAPVREDAGEPQDPREKEIEDAKKAAAAAKREALEAKAKNGGKTLFKKSMFGRKR